MYTWRTHSNFFPTMATKHLYECEDVAASLLYGIIEGDPTLAIRAAKELRVSGEEALLNRLVTLAWLLDDPENSDESLRMKLFCTQNYESLLFLITTSQKKSLPSLLEKSDALPPPLQHSLHSKHSHSLGTWRRLPHGWTEEQAEIAICSIRYALRKKYWQHAVYLTTPLIRGNILSLVSLLLSLGIPSQITDILETTVYIPLAERILMHAFAFLTQQGEQEQEQEQQQGQQQGQQKQQKQMRLEKIWNSTDLSGKQGRILQIRSEALSMWRIRRKSLSRILGGAPIIIAEEEATTYWSNAIKEYKIRLEKNELCFENENDQESFYEKYFPDDIPDEWSFEEQAKSHDIETSYTFENPWQTAFLLCWT
jgi:hypothetical protein